MRLRTVSIILVGTGLILGSSLTSEFLPDWRWTHLPFHALIEGMGSVVALIVATMILFLYHYRQLSPTYLWAASALARNQVITTVKLNLPRPGVRHIKPENNVGMTTVLNLSKCPSVLVVISIKGQPEFWRQRLTLCQIHCQQ